MFDGETLEKEVAFYLKWNTKGRPGKHLSLAAWAKVWSENKQSQAKKRYTHTQIYIYTKAPFFIAIFKDIPVISSKYQIIRICLIVGLLVAGGK